MAFILSDIHGDDKMIKYFIKNTDEHYCIQLGDFGFWFSETPTREEDKQLNSLENKLEKTEKYLFTILGNHECWPRYFKCPVISRWGAKCWAIRPHIYAVCPGEILDIEYRSFLCIGGANSTDGAWRLEYLKQHGTRIWWPEEGITDNDIENALENCKKYDNKVDFILTHTPPAFFTYKFYASTYLSESEDKLDIILNNCEYDQWLCGHVHEDCTISGCGKAVTSLGIDRYMIV